MESRFSQATSWLVSSCVRSNLGYQLLGEANRLLVEDDVEGLETILAGDGRAKRGVMLVFACVHGATRCAQYLVKQGAMQDVDMAACGETLQYFIPSTVAALLCHWEVVDALVEGGAEAHVIDSGELSAVSIAAHFYPKSNLESLLRLGSTCRHINTASPRGVTPLMVASASAVPLLVDAGAEVNLLGEKTGTALYQACLRACFEKVKALTECGADENQADPGGKTPLMCAVNNGHADIVEYLLARPSINIDAKTAKGVTAFDLACREGHLEVVKLLVGAGARVEGQEGDEIWVLMAAVVGGSLHVIKYLVEEAGVNEGRAARDGMTSLMVAAQQGHSDIVAYLLARPGINIDAKTPEGVTALDYACGKGHLDVAKLLVGAGAKLNELGPLTTAAFGGHLHVIKYLVEEAGAEETFGVPELKEGLLAAMEKGHTDIVEYLRPIVSRREKEALRVAEDRAAAAAAALLEEEERAAAAKEASSKKKKQKGKKKGGAAAPSHTPSTPAPEQEPTSTLEASETTNETRVMTAALSSLDLGQEATVTGREGQQERDDGSTASMAPTVPRISPAQDLQGGAQGNANSSDEVPEAAVAHVAPTEDAQDEACSIVVTSDELSCPISLQLMTDPVMADDGHTYQRHAIEEWIDKCIAAGRPLTSPLTGAEMGVTLRPNLLFRSLIRRRGGR